MFIYYRVVHQRILLKSGRSHIPRTSIRRLNDSFFQQPGKIIQQALSTSSVKGKIRSASKILISSDLDSMTTITTTTKRKKLDTLRAYNKDDTCLFKLQIICYKSDNK